MKLRQYTREDIHNQRVLVRCDLDVTVNDEGYVDSYHDLRLERIIPVLHDLFHHGARQIVLCGHRGRPRDGKDPALSLSPVCERLGDLAFADGLDEHIAFVEDVALDPFAQQEHPIVMLENLRFWKGEKAGDESFARKLASWGDVYVNDAFGNSHRADASMRMVAQMFTAAYAGPGLIKEIEHLESFRATCVKPYLAILGGAKISTKLPLIEQLQNEADHIILGGGIANTVLAAQGNEVGMSLVEAPMFKQTAALNNGKILLPQDAVVEDGSVHPVSKLSKQQAILDIGPKSIATIIEMIAKAKSILWNGPMGKFEDERFCAATNAIARAIAHNTVARTVAGGGETLEALERLCLVDRIGFVSTGGGAMLTFLADGDMPGLEAIQG